MKWIVLPAMAAAIIATPVAAGEKERVAEFKAGILSDTVDSTEALWPSRAAKLEPLGVSRDEFQKMVLLSTLGRHLGECDSFVTYKDISTWKQLVNEAPFGDVDKAKDERQKMRDLASALHLSGKTGDLRRYTKRDVMGAMCETFLPAIRELMSPIP